MRRDQDSAVIAGVYISCRINFCRHMSLLYSATMLSIQINTQPSKKTLFNDEFLLHDQWSVVIKPAKL